MTPTFRSLVRKIHLWTGLCAFVWLVLLGLTGVILNHHEWRWFRQYPVTDALASDQIMREQVRGTLIRQFAINPHDQRQMIAGGERGLWRTADRGAQWSPVTFEANAGPPRLLALFNDHATPWDVVWLATDDGLWQVAGAAGSAQPVILQGKIINFLAQDESTGTLLGVVDHSRVFTFAPASNRLTWLPLPKGGVDGLPDISLVRLFQDWHVGQGFFDGAWSRLWNDLAGLALAGLGVTGILAWLLPRHWRGKPRPARRTRSQILRWLFRLHGPTLGLFALIPLLALSASGLFLDHARALTPWLMEVELPQAALPGSYDLSNLKGEIHGVLPGADDRSYLIATRLGFLKTEDGGRSWTYDPATPLPIHRLTGHPHTNYRDGVAFMGAHGGPNFVRLSRTGPWKEVKGLRVLFQDAQRIDEAWVFKSSRGFYRGDLEGNIAPLDIAQPVLWGMPLGLMIEDLHTGLMISTGFVWINDLVAVLAIVLALTGLINWWHRKWM